MAKTLAQKLGVKPGSAALLWGAPEGFATGDDWPSGVRAGPPEPGVGYDHILAFILDAARLAEAAPLLIAAYRLGGHLWVAYPKKSGRIRSDLHRDAGWEPFGAADFLPVTQIAVDEDWSALRFRRRVEIPTLTRKADFPGCR